MPGQCYGCGEVFGIFKKEHGCKNCGYAFCSKCLNEKSIPVPKKNNAKHHVCHRCFKILTGTAPADTGQTKFELPEAYLKRMAALKEKESKSSTSGHSHSSGGGGQKIPAHLRNLDKADRDIALRLEKLREDKKPKEKVSDETLNARLAQLKGEAPASDRKPVYQPPDRRSEVQQVDDLMEQLTEEIAIDALRPDPVKDIESRLSHLRQPDAASTIGPAKPVDDNNLDTKDKDKMGGNNLNKVDKIGSMAMPYKHNVANAKGTDSSASGENIDMEEMRKLMADAAKELEVDAQKAIDDMQKDKELMDKLTEIKKRKDEKKNINDPEDFDSDADNTAQVSNAMMLDKAGGSGTDDEEDDDILAKKLIQRYLDESKIDEAVGGHDPFPKKSSSSSSSTEKKKGKKKEEKKKKISEGSSSSRGDLKSSNLKPPTKEEFADSDYDDSDELPYCCICTEDATLRCRDCDLDLYCQRCFKECHTEMDIMDHRTVSYKAPKGYS